MLGISYNAYGQFKINQIIVSEFSVIESGLNITEAVGMGSSSYRLLYIPVLINATLFNADKPINPDPRVSVLS